MARRPRGRGEFLHPLLAGTALLALSLLPAIPLKAQSSVVAPGAEVTLLADGFGFTEGPACDLDGNAYFTDQPNDRIHVWSADGKLSLFKEKAGRSNGLSFDGDGNLWACADEHNELWGISPAGEAKVVVRDYEERRLNGPNDLWVRPSGGLYFTDPFYPRDYWTHREKPQEIQGVYYLGPGGEPPRRVADDLVQPNGIIGTPDGKFLYVADIGARKTYRYAIEPDGTLTGKKLFCEMGSDGMTIDSEGNLYLTGMGVTVFSPEGERIQHIPVPSSWTANVCFCGKGRQTLVITASDKLFGLRMRVKGVGSQ